ARIGERTVFKIHFFVEDKQLARALHGIAGATIHDLQVVPVEPESAAPNGHAESEPSEGRGGARRGAGRKKKKRGNTPVPLKTAVKEVAEAVAATAPGYQRALAHLNLKRNDTFKHSQFKDAVEAVGLSRSGASVALNECRKRKLVARTATVGLWRVM